MLRLVVVCVSLPLLCGAADCSATLDKYYPIWLYLHLTMALRPKNFGYALGVSS